MESYLPVAAKTSIEKAVRLVQNTSIYPVLNAFYQRSTRNELIFVGAAAFLTLYNLSGYIKEKRRKLYSPPLAGYGWPLLGHIPYMLYDSSRFLDWCATKYGDVFDLKMGRSLVTVTTGASGEEVLKATHEDLSLEHGILRDVLFLHYCIDAPTFEIGMHVNPVIAKEVVPPIKVAGMTDSIVEGMDRGLKEMFGDKDRVDVKNPNFFFQRLVAYMSVPALLGDEFKTNETVIHTFADFTNDVTSNVGTFLAVPRPLHRFIMPFLQSIEKHRSVVREHIQPVIHARRIKMRSAAERGEEPDLAPSFLQGINAYVKPDGTMYTEAEVAQSSLLLAFASVHTTSMNLSFALHWLLARPDLREQLEKEIETVLGAAPITSEALKEMPFMDQFLREAIRQSTDKLANSKKVMPPNGYTFANGYQVPQGRTVEVMGRQLNFGLNTSRSTIADMDPSCSGSRLPTQPSRDYINFGLGRHLCPGRFFAVHELKIVLITVLRNYHVSTASGKPPRPVHHLFGMVAVTSEEPLVFI
ncbi:cytochrome P450, partial [Dichotomocladium elegans]